MYQCLSVIRGKSNKEGRTVPFTSVWGSYYIHCCNLANWTSSRNQIRQQRWRTGRISRHMRSNPFVDLALFYFAGYDLVITFLQRIAFITNSFTDGRVPDCHSRRPESVHTFSHRQLFMNQLRVKVRIICSHMGSSWWLCSKNVYVTYSTLCTRYTEFPRKKSNCAD